MNIIKVILLAIVTTTESFMNIHSNLQLKNNMLPLLYKPIFNKPKTSLKSNYLNNIENASYYDRIKPVLLPKPIPYLTFDQLFLILFSINNIYISSNTDRIIVEYDNKKGVFYINNFIEKNKIEYLLSLIDINVTIVNDYPTKMDYPSGDLYCSPNLSMKANITKEEIEDIVNGIIHKYETDNEISDYFDDPEDDIDRMI